MITTDVRIERIMNRTIRSLPESGVGEHNDTRYFCIRYEQALYLR